jgi:hypothetical protein
LDFLNQQLFCLPKVKLQPKPELQLCATPLVGALGGVAEGCAQAADQATKINAALNDPFGRLSCALLCGGEDGGGAGLGKSSSKSETPGLARSSTETTESSAGGTVAEAEGAAQSTKSPPNPNGRNGSPEHQAEIGAIADDLENRGFDVRFEVKYGNRYVDVQGIHPTTGEEEAYQVGRQTKGGIPVARCSRRVWMTT